MIRLHPRAFDHRHSLELAWLLGVLPTRLYAVLWRSHWIFGRNWRLN